MNQTISLSKYKFDEREHCHSWDGKPLIGTTTALGIISKPLTYWAVGLAVSELGWLNAKKVSKEECILSAGIKLAEIQAMTKEEYYKLLEKAYRAHSQNLKKTAGEGIDLHGQIESFIKARLKGIEKPGSHVSIQDFVLWSYKNVKRFLFSELHCYSESLWVGGIADFGYEDMNGNLVLGDIKSSKEAYFSQWVQLAAYDLQISENGGFTASGEKIFALDKPFSYHAIFAAAAGLGEPFFNYGIDRTKKSFTYAVNLYKEKLFHEKDRI